MFKQCYHINPAHLGAVTGHCLIWHHCCPLNLSNKLTILTLWISLSVWLSMLTFQDTSEGASLLRQRK